MAGHSKWANIKHRKSAQDAKRGKIFQKLAREIAVAAKNGSSLENNPSLRLIVAKARSFNMPKEKIQTAIKKGSGALREGLRFEELIYECTGHNGSLMILEILSDKPSRTRPVIKSILGKHGWNLGTPNSAMYAFKRAGRIIVNRKGLPLEKMEEIVLMTCADDFLYDDEYYVLYCDTHNIEQMLKELKDNGITEFEDVAKGLFSNTEVQLSDKHNQSFQKILEALENEEDVVNIYHNVIINSNV